jgi:hypothetical protein
MSSYKVGDTLTFNGFRFEILKVEVLPGCTRYTAKTLCAASYKDAGAGVMFPRTVDPNAPAAPKPPSTLPKAAPSIPVVTRTGTSKAGPQTARLVPCTKSQWHKHHPANELCGECDPPKKSLDQEMDDHVKALAEKMKAFRAPLTGGYPPWAASARPVQAVVEWHVDGSGTWFDPTCPMPSNARRIALATPNSTTAQMACGCHAALAYGGHLALAHKHYVYIGTQHKFPALTTVCANPGVVEDPDYKRTP